MEKLRENDIEVRESWREGEMGVRYVFDFDGERDLRGLVTEGVRWVGIEINGVSKDWRCRQEEWNWRIIQLVGVVGVGMEEWGGGGVMRWWIEAVRQAIKNENLVLPAETRKWPMMTVERAVEGVLGLTFMGMAERQVLPLVGEEIGAGEMAAILIEEAKMTRKKIREEEVVLPEMSAKAREVREWLGWGGGEGDWSGKLRGTVRYFFGKTDEEMRRGEVKKIVEVASQPKSGWWRVETEDTGEKVLSPSAGEQDTSDKIPEEVEPIEEVEDKNPVLLVDEESRSEEIEEEREDLSRDDAFRLAGEEGKGEIEDEEGQEAEMIGDFSIGSEREEEIQDLRSAAMASRNYQAGEKQDQDKRPEKKAEIVRKLRPKWQKNWWQWLLGGWGLVVLVIVMIVGSQGWYLTQISKRVEKAGVMVKSADWKALGEEAEKNIKMLRKKEDWWLKWGGLMGKWGGRGLSVVRLEESGWKMVGEGVLLAGRYESWNRMIWEGEGEIDWPKETEEFQKRLAGMLMMMGEVEARMGDDWSWLSGEKRNEVTKIKEEIGEVRKKLETGMSVVGILPDLLGVGGRKEYLVLFQNQTELRAGGGFIGSVGFLSTEGGKINGFEVRDVYELDGQLKGHVEPPGPIRTILGEANYYLRDANYKADFREAAKEIEWFLEKETGRKTDGVIGVNLEVVRAILSVIGEVWVPDYKERISEGNLYEQAQHYAESKFFPGSNQKESFLAGLSRQMWEEIKGAGMEKKLQLMEKLLVTLDENEVQVAMGTSRVAEVMNNLGWDGALVGGECPGESCVADYLYVVESNFGVNKANYFLKRSMEKMVDIGEGVVARVVRINYENQSRSTNWPGGDYRNYLRVYLPREANVAEVSVTEVATGKKQIYNVNDLSMSEVAGKKEVGLLVVVPVGRKIMVELRYSSQYVVGPEKVSYMDYWQKQSGFGDTSWLELVSAPKGWQVDQVYPAASMMGGKIMFNGKFKSDVKLGVELAR